MAGDKNIPSKSAINVLAPELSALTTILRSVGPVISTRRSSRPGAGTAHTHDGSARMWAVSAGKSSCAPASSRRWAAWRADRRCVRYRRWPATQDCDSKMTSVSEKRAGRNKVTDLLASRVKGPVQRRDELDSRFSENLELGVL